MNAHTYSSEELNCSEKKFSNYNPEQDQRQSLLHNIKWKGLVHKIKCLITSTTEDIDQVNA